MQISANDCLRDLCWAVNSPPLLESAPLFSEADTEMLAHTPVMDAAQIDAEQLASFVNERPTERVGRYFERLIEYYLRYVRKVDLIAAGQVIERDGRTLGELDFVFDEAGRRRHWETAVKFFLCCRSEAGLAYLGPNANDSLASKATRLFGHQLSMGAKAYPDVLSQALVRGRIFYHPLGAQSLPTPSYLAVDHLRGYWMPDSELKHLSDLLRGAMVSATESDRADELRLAVVKKPRWLSPIVRCRGDERGLLSIELARRWLTAHFQRAPRPHLLAVMNRQADGSWREMTRMFVVSHHWPGRRP